MKVKIKNKDFTIHTIQGNTVSSEFNETLDGASIVINGVKRQNFKPFDDIYLYEGTFIPQPRLVEKREVYSFLEKGATYQEGFNFVVSSSIEKETDKNGWNIELYFYIRLPGLTTEIERRYNFENFVVNEGVSVTITGGYGTFLLTYDQERDVYLGSITQLNEQDLVWEDIIGTDTTFEKDITHNVVVERPDFYKHFLASSIIEEELLHGEDLATFKYTIDLMSETKGLELKTLPNSAITQPLVPDKKKTIWEHLQKYVRLYSPEKKVATNTTDKTWAYLPKYELDPALEDIFGDVYCPDFSFSTPTLRDVLTQLMLVKDCIPVVKDGIISAMKIGESTGTFDYTKGKITSVKKLQDSESYAQNLVKQYSGAISQDNSARSIEMIGFRNSERATLKLEDLRIETRFPIYKINKILLCYYKTFQETTPQGVTTTRTMLVKQDITPLVLLENERGLLSLDWDTFEGAKPTTMEQLAQYKLCTVGYARGSNYITGWGTIYTYPRGWWEYTKTYLENILNVVDGMSPYGINTFAKVRSDKKNNIVATTQTWKQTMIAWKNSPTIADFFKSLMFEIDYNAMYNGRIVHSKDNALGDLEAIDNASQPLTILESDGIFEKEKANRFGNAVYIMTMFYDNISDIQELGTVLEQHDNAIVYRSDVSFSVKGIIVNYYASADYVLRNYYTSVWSKHRTYNLMGYDESVRRSENIKQVFLLSRSKLLFEEQKKVSFTNFYGSDFTQMLFTAFKSSPLVDTVGDIQQPDKINSAFFSFNGVRYFTDIHNFVSGNSLCFNLAMYDNVSSGIYIRNANPSNLEGALQDWYFAIDDQETGEIANLSLSFCHLDLDGYINAGASSVSRSVIQQNFTDKLFLSPKVHNASAGGNISNRIAINNLPVEKDNKELLDFTLQFEPLTSDKNIFFTEWLMKLNDLSGSFLKTQSDYEVYDTNANVLLAQMLSYTRLRTLLNRGDNELIMVLRVPQDQEQQITGGKELEIPSITWEGRHTETSEVFSVIMGTQLIVSPIRILSRAGNNVSVECGLTVRGATTYNYAPLDTWFLVGQNTATLTFTKQATAPNGSTDFLCRISGSVTLEQVVGDARVSRGGKDLSNGKDSNSDIANTNMNATNSLVYNANILTPITDGNSKLEPYKQNMFIYTRDTPVNKELMKNELKPEDMGAYGFTLTDKLVGSVFQVETNNFGNLKWIYVNLDGISTVANKSVQYWFLDERTGLLNLVFGVNFNSRTVKTKITKELDENGNEAFVLHWYMKIYISNIANNSQEIFDNEGEVVGESKNFANIEEEIGRSQTYESIEEN